VAKFPPYPNPLANAYHYTPGREYPEGGITRLKNKRDDALNALFNSPEGSIPSAILASREHIKGVYHLGIDDALHELSNGPYHMSKPEIAEIVMDCLKWLAENERWFLYSVCIMGNHLHVVARVPDGQEELDLGPIINSFKTFTSNRGNKVLGTTGSAFWAPVYYDRDVRKGKFTRVMWYVLNNPVAARLVDSWMDWRFTYVHPEYLELFRLK
jgi:REP element-mobilizing transposase RayT